MEICIKEMDDDRICNFHMKGFPVLRVFCVKLKEDMMKISNAVNGFGTQKGENT